jgi:signal transduction histidine kinase
MTDTPETDELHEDICNGPYVEGRDYEKMFQHARELERERDEAQKLIDDIWITVTSDHRFCLPPSQKYIPQHIKLIIKSYDQAFNDWTPKEIKNLMRERDEARDALSDISLYLSVGMGDNSTMAHQYYERIIEGIQMLTRPITQMLDEARADAEKAKAYKKVLKTTNENLKRERDKLAEALRHMIERIDNYEKHMAKSIDFADEALQSLSPKEP